MATKDHIFPNDTYPIAYECRKPDENDPHNTYGLPATPLSAFVRLYDKQGGAFVDLGGLDGTATATIEAATGTSSSDKGAIVRYTIPAEFTLVPSDYTVLTTAVFADGVVLTEDRTLKIIEIH